MNRNKKIEKLMNEGFTAETLVSFSDSNINSLYKRIVSENEEKNVKLNSDTKDIKNVIDNLQKQGVEDIEISEENKKKIVDKKKSRKLAVTTEQLKMIVKNMVNEKYSSFTTKKEINEKINSIANVDKKENKIKIPEFMTYDSIKSTAPAPTITPTKPKTAPSIKPRTPYNPGPGKNPKPKALAKGIGK